MTHTFTSPLKKTVTLLLAFALQPWSGGWLSAQQAPHLTIDEAADRAANSSTPVQLAELDRQLAAADYRQTDAVLLPQLQLGYQAVVTNNPRNAFGFLLQQEGVTQQAFDPSRLNSPGAAHNIGTTVEARVPLLNLDLLYARKGARLQQEVRGHQLAYTRQHIAFATRKAYTQLQFAYALRHILSTTLDDVKQIHRSVSNFRDQGLVQQSDVLNAQVQVNTVESALAKAQSNIANASEALAMLMGQGTGQQTIFTVDSLSQVPPMPSGSELPASRPDLMAMKTAITASKTMEKSAFMAMMPKVNAFGSYQLNDTRMLGFGHDSYMAGLSLSWNIFSGNRNTAKLKAARIATAKVQKQLDELVDNSRLEIAKARRDLSDRQTEIDKQQASVQQATEALRITNNRYHEGLANTTDVLTAQAQLSQQRMALAQAVMEYNITTYYLRLLTTE